MHERERERSMNGMREWISDHDGRRFDQIHLILRLSSISLTLSSSSFKLGPFPRPPVIIITPWVKMKRRNVEEGKRERKDDDDNDNDDGDGHDDQPLLTKGGRSAHVEENREKSEGVTMESLDSLIIGLFQQQQQQKKK